MTVVRLLVVRHAEAIPQGTSGVRDADRPLTGDGERRFRAAARTIARLEPPPATLLTSPLVRARQTAAILATAWGAVEPVAEPALAAGSVDTLVELLERQPRDARVAIVGHEPTMSGLTMQLLGVVSSEAVALSVGTAALLDVSSPLTRGARLVWLLPAEVAEALAGGPQ